MNDEPLSEQHIAEIKTCANLIRELIATNRHDLSVWFTAFQGLCASAMHANGRSYKEYSDGMERIRKHYKRQWEQQ
jgi:hypothetical protein